MAAFAVLRAETPLWNCNGNDNQQSAKVKSASDRDTQASLPSAMRPNPIRTYQDIHFSECAIFRLGLDEGNAQVSCSTSQHHFEWVCPVIFLTKRKYPQISVNVARTAQKNACNASDGCYVSTAVQILTVLPFRFQSPGDMNLGCRIPPKMMFPK